VRLPAAARLRRRAPDIWNEVRDALKAQQIDVLVEFDAGTFVITSVTGSASSKDYRILSDCSVVFIARQTDNECIDTDGVSREILEPLFFPPGSTRTPLR
jgi:hypothetical protein